MTFAQVALAKAIAAEVRDESLFVSGGPCVRSRPGPASAGQEL